MISKIKICFVLILFFFVGCHNKDKSSKKCSLNKNFDFKCLKKSDLENVKRCSVFAKGQLKMVVDSMIKNGKRERFGDFLLFYDNRQIRLRGCFQHGVKHGQFIEYRKNGTIRKIVEYVWGDKNNIYHFNKDGEFSGKGSYVNVKCRDTISKNEKLKVKVEVVNPRLGTSWFLGGVGNQLALDRKFRVIDSTHFDYIDIKGKNSFNFYIKNHEMGRNEARGYLNNVKNGKGSKDSVTTYTYYFREPYYVIEDSSRPS